jgi:AcrR family transcriptional regulator
MSNRSSIRDRETAQSGSPDPAPDRRRQRHEHKRARIIAAAWELARRDGLAGISLRDLADQVDLRQPSLYAYFESKLDLYDAMFADGNRQMVEAVRARATVDDPIDELVGYVELLVRVAGEEPVRHQLLFQRTLPGFEPSPAAFAPALEFYEEGRRRLAAAGVDHPDDMDVFTAVMAGMTHQQVANDPGGTRWVRLARRMVEMFLADAGHRRRERGAGDG